MTAARLALSITGISLCLAGWHRGHTPDAALIIPGVALIAIAFGIAVVQAAA